MIGTLQHKNCLLLQGPMGPFFRRLDKAIRKQGGRVFRICFNGGDFFFAHKDNSTCYTNRPEQWPAFLSRFVEKHRIDTIFLYGDCRFYHRKAVEVASSSGIDVFVFEEGYVRPYYITLEKGGVNALSSMSRDADSYRDSENPPVEDKLTARQAGVTNPFQKWSCYTVLYYLFMRFYAWHFPHYRHHRNDSVLQEAAFGMRNFWRKIGHQALDQQIEHRLRTDLKKKFFFVPLQTLGDTQITCHSPFTDMKTFIDVVMRSFANHAPADLFLVIKHHPLDRGRVNYKNYIQRLALNLGISDRVFSVHDLHLPTCLEHAVGTITVNSTVGISSLTHGTPTLALGEAVYDIEGLTCKGMPLYRFWTRCKEPEGGLFRRFRAALIQQTQLVGSFYSRFPEQLAQRP